jgi:hypothetical protein
MIPIKLAPDSIWGGYCLRKRSCCTKIESGRRFELALSLAGEILLLQHGVDAF